MENVFCSEDKSRSCVVKIVPSSRTLKAGSLDKIRLADLRHWSRFTAGRHFTAMSGSSLTSLTRMTTASNMGGAERGVTLNTCPSEM